MSEEAKSERPQVVAIGWRCMKASTALQASVSRRQRRAVREDAGIDHQQLTGRTWLASEHDPTEAHLRIDLQDEFRQPDNNS